VRQGQDVAPSPGLGDRADISASRRPASHGLRGLSWTGWDVSTSVCEAALRQRSVVLGRAGATPDISCLIPDILVAAQDLLFAANTVAFASSGTSIAASGMSFALSAMPVAASDTSFAWSARGLAVSGGQITAKAMTDLLPASLLTASGTRGQTAGVQLAA
jgi:hypothetical protein